MMNDDDEDMVMMDSEPIIHALVLRMNPPELRMMRKFLTEHNITVVYKRTSYAPLYITHIRQSD